MEKLNCWQFKNCGREVNGEHADDLDVCPAAREFRLDGVHGGRNAGRACWVLVGMLCKGSIQGNFGQKFHDCRACDFYEKVKKEEFPRFELSAVLIRKLGNDSRLKIKFPPIRNFANDK